MSLGLKASLSFSCCLRPLMFLSLIVTYRYPDYRRSGCGTGGRHRCHLAGLCFALLKKVSYHEGHFLLSAERPPSHIDVSCIRATCRFLCFSKIPVYYKIGKRKISLYAAYKRRRKLTIANYNYVENAS